MARRGPASGGRSRHGGKGTSAHSTNPAYNSVDAAGLARATYMREKEHAADGSPRNRKALHLELEVNGVWTPMVVEAWLSDREVKRYDELRHGEYRADTKEVGWLRILSQDDSRVLMRFPASPARLDNAPSPARKGMTPASFLDATRPLPTPEMAKRLPPPWRTSVSEALEVKYMLAQWAGMPQGVATFDMLTDAIGPGAARQGPSNDRSRLARTLFQRTCMEAPLYLCSPTSTEAVLAAAEVLEDWTPVPELMPHDNGAVILFEQGIQMSVAKQGKFTGTEEFGDAGRSIMELRGIVITNVYFGTHSDDRGMDPTRVVADEMVDNVRKFSARVKQWTQRMHMSALMGSAGIALPMPFDLVGWNMGLPLSKHRAQWDSFEGVRSDYWRAEDEMEARLLGALLLWIKQRIVVHSARKADRGTRRRIEGMSMKPNPEADINVIELRARDYMSHKQGGDDEDPAEIDWQCRWIVRPHWHKFRCGKGRTIIQSKWVEAYIKGPEGKPLKQPKPTVFAVVR
jgi:hypothetical protein